MKQFIINVFIAATAFMLVGCGATTNPFHSTSNTSTVYSSGQKLTNVKFATVVQVRDVRVAQSPVLGQRVGAASAGAIGYAVSRKLTSNRTAQVAIAGLIGTIGAEAGKQAASTVPGQEIVVLMENKRVYVVAQASTDGVFFRPGDKVMVVGGGRIAPVY